MAETGTHIRATDAPQIVQLRALIADLRVRRATVIEEYWGLASAMGAPRTALPTDSVIHALGAARAEYLKAWDKAPPDIIVTTRPQFAPDWQGWSVSFNWWFYRRVLENYAPHLRNRTTVAWQRRASPATTTALVCDLHTTAAGPELVIQPDAAGGTTRIADVEVRYSLMRTGPRPRACLNPPLLFADNRVDQRFGSVSLDPRGGQAVFPALMRPGAMTKVPFRWMGCGDYQLTLSTCRARAIADLNADTVPPPPVPAAPGR